LPAWKRKAMPKKVEINHACREIKVHHVTRVEGHGNIFLSLKAGRVEKVEWQVPEAPRFFEAMVLGRSWEDIQTIVSRICGICSVTHSLAAIKAIEDAMQIKVSGQTDRLRILLHYAEQIESHVLHVGYLVAPDLFGMKSVVPLAAKSPDLVKLVISLHRLGNSWMELLGGAHDAPRHPETGRFFKAANHGRPHGPQETPAGFRAGFQCRG